MSHHVIRILVRSSSEQDALAQAKSYADELAESNEFDYATFFDGDKSPVSGAARWGHRVASVRLDKKIGMQYFLDGIHLMYREFSEKYEQMKKTLEKHTKEEIFYDEGMLQYHMTLNGYGSGWIFAKDHGRITSLHDLNWFLQDGIKTEGGVNDVYVCLADVHT